MSKVQTITIDFTQISSNQGFYEQLKAQYTQIASYFGDNLDALQDVLRDADLHIVIINCGKARQEQYKKIFTVMNRCVDINNNFSYEVIY